MHCREIEERMMMMMVCWGGGAALGLGLSTSSSFNFYHSPQSHSTRFLHLHHHHHLSANNIPPTKTEWRFMALDSASESDANQDNNTPTAPALAGWVTNCLFVRSFDWSFLLCYVLENEIAPNLFFFQPQFLHHRRPWNSTRFCQNGTPRNSG